MWQASVFVCPASGKPSPWEGSAIVTCDRCHCADGNWFGFYIPRTYSLWHADEQGRPALLGRIEAQFGEDDWQPEPQALVSLCNTTGIEVYLVPQRGHLLGADYVGALLNRWLAAD